MNRTYASISALALAALMATPAFADTSAPAKTRAQVRAELAEAIRTGDILANDEGSLKLNEQRPDLYPQVATSNKSRAEVRAELAEAVRTGDIVVGSEGNETLNQRFPGFYAQKNAVRMHEAQAASTQATRM
jgi:hypothetical protein